MKRTLFILILVLNLIFITGCFHITEPPAIPITQTTTKVNPPPLPKSNPNLTTEKRTLISDIKNSQVIAWIAPHCDDEIFASALLAYASFGLNKTVYVISLHKGGVAFPPGAGVPERLQDNQDFKNLVGLKDYVYGDFSEYPRNKENATKNYLTDIIDELTIDVIITFENTNGGYGHQEHIQVSNWITEFARKNNVKLYYVINRDSAVSSSKIQSIDPLPFTDTLDLNNHQITLADNRQLSLWETKMEVLEIYKSSVPMVVKIVETPELYDNLMHIEHYRLVN